MSTAPNQLNAILRDMSSQLKTYNTALDFSCHKRLGISMTLYRYLKLAFNTLGVAGAIYMVSQGAPPSYGIAVFVLIYGGGEVLETFLVSAGFHDLLNGPTVPDGYEMVLKKSKDDNGDDRD